MTERGIHEPGLWFPAAALLGITTTAVVSTSYRCHMKTTYDVSAYGVLTLGLAVSSK